MLRCGGRGGWRVNEILGRGTPGSLVARMEGWMTYEKRTAIAQGTQGIGGYLHSDERGLQFREVPAEVNQLARRVIDAAVEVHRHLGPGYQESVYENALAVELGLRGISFQRQAGFNVDYKGHGVGEGRMDLLVDRVLVVELKAVDRLTDVHVSQAISYLKATRLPLALLINFDVPVLMRGVRRVVLNRSTTPDEGARHSEGEQA
jgi:GxxExxY protein